MVFKGVWLIIGLKWRLKVVGHVPICFRRFWEDSKLSPNMDAWSPYLLPEMCLRIWERESFGINNELWESVKRNFQKYEVVEL